MVEESVINDWLPGDAIPRYSVPETRIAAALEESGYFTPLMINLVASGEAGGRLGEMLLRGADTQERDNAATVATLIGVFEPLLILVMGGIVLVVVLAILMPIFEMNQLVN